MWTWVCGRVWRWGVMEWVRSVECECGMWEAYMYQWGWKCVRWECVWSVEEWGMWGCGCWLPATASLTHLICNAHRPALHVLQQQLCSPPNLSCLPILALRLAMTSWTCSEVKAALRKGNRAGCLATTPATSHNWTNNTHITSISCLPATTPLLSSTANH